MIFGDCCLRIGQIRAEFKVAECHETHVININVFLRCKIWLNRTANCPFSKSRPAVFLLIVSITAECIYCMIWLHIKTSSHQHALTVKQTVLFERSHCFTNVPRNVLFFIHALHDKHIIRATCCRQKPHSSNFRILIFVIDTCCSCVMVWKEIFP